MRAPRILVDLIGEEDNIIPENDFQPHAEDQMSAYAEQDNATPVHIAAKLGNLSLLRQLVGTSTSAGGRGHRRRVLTASDRNGWQPLHEACRGGHTEVVRYLVVEQGEYVDIHATANGGQSSLSLSQQYHGENHAVTQILQEIIDQEGSDSASSSADEDDESY